MIVILSFTNDPDFPLPQLGEYVRFLARCIYLYYTYAGPCRYLYTSMVLGHTSSFFTTPRWLTPYVWSWMQCDFRVERKMRSLRRWTSICERPDKKGPEKTLGIIVNGDYSIYITGYIWYIGNITVNRDDIYIYIYPLNMWASWKKGPRKVVLLALPATNSSHLTI